MKVCVCVCAGVSILQPEPYTNSSMIAVLPFTGEEFLFGSWTSQSFLVVVTVDECNVSSVDQKLRVVMPVDHDSGDDNDSPVSCCRLVNAGVISA